MAAVGRSLCDLLNRPPPVYPRCCIRVPSDIVHDPDPATYDQRLLFESGGAPSFNSPDIDTFYVWPLQPITNLAVRLRNLSALSSANQTRVDLSSSVFGIGMPRQALGSFFIDLPRAGFPGSQGQVSMPLPPALNSAGVYGIFVNIIHPYDLNVANNAGEQTVDGFQTSKDGRSKSFTFPVGNPSGSPATIALTAGPPGVGSWVTISPSTFSLAPGAQTAVAAAVVVPAAIAPSPPGTEFSATIDILATIDGTYLGGLSIVILIDA
jgi:hypothetical protein